MNPRFQLRQLVVLLLVVCALAAGGVYWFRLRSAARPSDLVAYLPTANASVIYIDVDALRRSGILGMVVGSKTAEEPDYQQFVGETKFDYRQDLDAVAAALKDGRTYFALRGRFHWNNLRDYAVRHGGSCHNDFCVLAGSQPNRRISFYLLKRDVMAMAIGPDDFGAYQVTSESGKLALAAPKEPVWALIPAAALDFSRWTRCRRPRRRMCRPCKVRSRLYSVSARIPAQQLQLGVNVTCKDAPAATALVTQFEGTTKALRELLGAPAPKARSSRFERRAGGWKFSARRAASIRSVADPEGICRCNFA